MKLVGVVEIAQSHAGVFHRADGADQIAVHAFRLFPAALAVFAPAGNIVTSGGQKNQIALPAQVQTVDNPPVEFLPRGGVLQTGIPQGTQKAVFRAVHHLLGGKDNIHQILAQGTGQNFFQPPQIHFYFLFREKSQRGIQIGDNLPAGVYVTAVNTADRAPVRTEQAAQFVDFFQIHKDSSSSGDSSSGCGAVSASSGG